MVSIDSSAAVDLYASASDSEICLRVLSTQRYLRTIAYEPLSGRFWAIYKVFLSAKGYIVLQLRRRARDCDEDAVVVYSINGVKVIERRLKELLNSIVMEPTTQYHIITGGVNGVTKKYFIITMEEEILDMEPSAILFLDYIESNGLIVGFNNKLKHLYWELKDD